MSSSPPPPPKTILGKLTQIVSDRLGDRIDFSKLKLKANAKVPELWVQDAGAEKAQIYPLLGDRYMLGRSSQCDIVIRNPVVSQVHLSLSRPSQVTGPLGGRPPFTLQDEGSTNGIYRGKRRLKGVQLHHKDVYTLGPAELEGAVRIQYIDPPPWYKQVLKYSVVGFAGLSALSSLLVLLEWQKFDVSPLPSNVQGPVMIFAGDDQTPLAPLTTRTHAEAKTLAEFSPFLPQAVIASEDSRYYWHMGVDPIGTVRALVTNVQGGGIREGGSTLTQQLARNLLREYVGTQDSAGRKLREAAVALKLETVYSKDFLLLTYLNRVYMGFGLYGFEDAAQFYFDKPAKNLTLSEAATLAGILPAPNSFNPVRNYKKAIELRDRILYRMESLGMVSSEAAKRARRSRVDVSPKAKAELSNSIAPYYYSYVFEELEQLLGPDLAREGNFIVYTGLDPKMQARAESALSDTVVNIGSGNGFSQGAIVTIDSRNGEIRALVGGANYLESQFNRASQAERQPGSTFKVFAYAEALAKGTAPGTTYSCAPLNWGGQDFAGCRSGGGAMDMFSGISQSENVVALRVAQDVGLGNVAAMARRMGISSKLEEVPGLVLGQSIVTPLEMTGAFSVFANNGVRNRPRAIRRILDSSDCVNRNDINTCRVMYSPEQDSEVNQTVLAPEVAATMTTLMQGVVRSGTGKPAAIGRSEAGKTGTTNDNVDLWFIGYVPGDLVTGVWLGNDDNTPTSGSSAVAAQLWGRYMSQIVR